MTFGNGEGSHSHYLRNFVKALLSETEEDGPCNGPRIFPAELHLFDRLLYLALFYFQLSAELVDVILDIMLEYSGVPLIENPLCLGDSLGPLIISELEIFFDLVFSKNVLFQSGTGDGVGGQLFLRQVLSGLLRKDEGFVEDGIAEA
jgi:hypothetical protein